MEPTLGNNFNKRDKFLQNIKDSTNERERGGDKKYQSDLKMMHPLLFFLMFLFFLNFSLSVYLYKSRKLDALCITTINNSF